MTPLTVRPIVQPLAENVLPAVAGALTTAARHFSSAPSTPEVLNKTSVPAVRHSGASRGTAGTDSAEGIEPQKETSVAAEQAVAVIAVLSPLLMEAIPLMTALLKLQISNLTSGVRGRTSTATGDKTKAKPAEAPKSARQAQLRREQAAAQARQAVLKKAEALVNEFAIIDKGVSDTLVNLVEELQEIEQLLKDAPDLAKEKGMTTFRVRFGLLSQPW